MKQLLKKMALGMTFSLCVGTTTWAQSYTPTPENLQARKEFQDNKFGIFLHWGIYSMTAQGEWYMNNRNIHRDEYAKLASGFYPSEFDGDCYPLDRQAEVCESMHIVLPIANRNLSDDPKHRQTISHQSDHS